VTQSENASQRAQPCCLFDATTARCPGACSLLRLIGSACGSGRNQGTSGVALFGLDAALRVTRAAKRPRLASDGRTRRRGIKPDAGPNTPQPDGVGLQRLLDPDHMRSGASTALTTKSRLLRKLTAALPRPGSFSAARFSGVTKRTALAQVVVAAAASRCPVSAASTWLTTTLRQMSPWIGHRRVTTSTPPRVG
jgi:hypothetical protein